LGICGWCGGEGCEGEDRVGCCGVRGMWRGN
jgi:hypothetical protein